MFLHNFTLANYDKLTFLKNRKLSKFDCNELKDFKINFQTTYSHQNMGYLDNDVNVLLKINDKLYEIDEKNLDDIVIKLKEIYNKIKI